MTVGNPIETQFDWEGRTIRLSYYPLKWSVIDHLEIHVENKEPLPITETGYYSQFIEPMDPLLTVEEIVETVRYHLEAAAKSRSWIEAEAARKQLSLF